jgi:hypothetical protein
MRTASTEAGSREPFSKVLCECALCGALGLGPCSECGIALAMDYNALIRANRANRPPPPLYYTLTPPPFIWIHMNCYELKFICMYFTCIYLFFGGFVYVIIRFTFVSFVSTIP